KPQRRGRCPADTRRERPCQRSSETWAPYLVDILFYFLAPCIIAPHPEEGVVAISKPLTALIIRNESSTRPAMVGDHHLLTSPDRLKNSLRFQAQIPRSYLHRNSSMKCTLQNAYSSLGVSISVTTWNWRGSLHGGGSSGVDPAPLTFRAPCAYLPVLCGENPSVYQRPPAALCRQQPPA